ncbi:MAG: HIT family hydrolase, partial [Chloroflexota bacterium]
KTSLQLLEKAMRPMGFNVGLNLGKVAGAGMAEHIHTHIVPRWQGDTNFMPVLSDTKILSEALISTYKKLKAKL